MEPFTAGGVFWLSGESQRRTPGELTFDSDGVRLLLHDSMEEFIEPSEGIVGIRPEWKTLPMVHGRLYDDREVTLLEVTGISAPGPYVTTHEPWYAGYALVGGCIEVTEFNYAELEYDALLAWANPDSIVTESEDRKSVVIDYPGVAILAEKSFDDGQTLRLATRARGTWNGTGVHMDQSCAFQVTTSPAPLPQILDNWARPLQDLLIVCLGRPVRLSALRVSADDRNGQTRDLDVFFQAVQSHPESPPTPAGVQAYNAPTLLTAMTTGTELAGLLRNWFEVRDTHAASITLFCGPFYAPFMYAEHRYVSTFQAAEALARKTYESSELEKSEHRTRVEAVDQCLGDCEIDPSVADWARRVLLARNDKPLQELIRELIDGTGELGEYVLGVDPQLPKKLASARAGASHGGAGKEGPQSQYWLGEILGWVVRVHLLTELGVSSAALSERVLGNPRFRRALDEVAGDVSKN